MPQKEITAKTCRFGAILVQFFGNAPRFLACDIIL